MSIVQQSLTRSGLAVAYIALIATVMSNAERILGPGPDKGPLAPMLLLLLFVVSAAVMGMLIFGTPVMLYIDGKKREAVAMVGWTIGSLAALTAIFIAILALMRT